MSCPAARSMATGGSQHVDRPPREAGLEIALSSGVLQDMIRSGSASPSGQKGPYLSQRRGPDGIRAISPFVFTAVICGMLIQWVDHYPDALSSTLLRAKLRSKA